MSRHTRGPNKQLVLEKTLRQQAKEELANLTALITITKGSAEGDRGNVYGVR